MYGSWTVVHHEHQFVDVLRAIFPLYLVVFLCALVIMKCTYFQGDGVDCYRKLSSVMLVLSELSDPTSCNFTFCHTCFAKEEP